jgi:hypothetical protein
MPRDVNTDKQTKAQLRPTNCHDPKLNKAIELSLTNQNQAPTGTDERIKGAKEEKYGTNTWRLELVFGGDQTVGQPLCMRHRVLLAYNRSACRRAMLHQGPSA